MKMECPKCGRNAESKHLDYDYIQHTCPFCGWERGERLPSQAEQELRTVRGWAWEAKDLLARGHLDGVRTNLSMILAQLDEMLPNHGPFEEPMEIEFTAAEQAVLTDLARRQDLTEAQALRQALRIYQLIVTEHSKLVEIDPLPKASNVPTS